MALKRPESVLVVVHTRDRQVLLLKRVHPVFWQSVTGSLKWPDETPQAAAVRELREETGIEETGGLRDWQITNRFEIRPEWSHRYGPGVTENIEHLFSLALPATCDITINPREHSTYQWLAADAAIETVWSWTNREAIERIAAELA